MADKKQEMKENERKAQSNSQKQIYCHNKNIMVNNKQQNFYNFSYVEKIANNLY